MTSQEVVIALADDVDYGITDSDDVELPIAHEIPRGSLGAL
jgi:hypothetical protein